MVGIFISINVHNSLKCTVTNPFFSINHFLLWFFCILSENKKNLNMTSFNFITISTQIRSNFSTHAFIYDLQLSFCEANFTCRNDITCKNVPNRPICDEINKTALSRVLHVTYFIPCSKKANFASHNQTRRARRGHEAACSEKLLRLLSDRAQTLLNNRTFYSKQSYRFCFLILTVFGGKMTPQC